MCKCKDTGENNAIKNKMFFQQAFLLLTYSFNNLDDDNDIQLNHSRYGHDFRDSLDNKECKKSKQSSQTSIVVST